MAQKRQAAEEKFYCMKTDASCTDKRMGSLLARYLVGELAPLKEAAFEAHRQDCVACGTAVLNWQNLKAAASYFSVQCFHSAD